MIKKRYLIFLIIIQFSCNRIIIKEKITENYYLVATDIPEATFLSYHEDSDGNDYSIIIEGGVFAIGYNDNYMIAKQHPLSLLDVLDKSVTNFFILPMKESFDYRTKNGLIGPLTETEFIEKRIELGISEKLIFTKVIEDLE